jgi:hypothetical protein
MHIYYEIKIQVVKRIFFLKNEEQLAFPISHVVPSKAMPGAIVHVVSVGFIRQLRDVQIDEICDLK